MYTYKLEVAANQCDHPTETPNGNITFQDGDPANIFPGDMIEYICNEGTELEGPQYRFCLRSGNWSDSEPQCVGEELLHRRYSCRTIVYYTLQMLQRQAADKSQVPVGNLKLI